MKVPGILAAMLLVIVSPLAAAPAPRDCPMRDKSANHADCPLAAKPAHRHDPALERRGDEGMGFSQAKTMHHFRLANDGGSIEVTVRDAKDSESIGRVTITTSDADALDAVHDFLRFQIAGHEIGDSAAVPER